MKLFEKIGNNHFKQNQYFLSDEEFQSWLKSEGFVKDENYNMLKNEKTHFFVKQLGNNKWRAYTRRNVEFSSNRNARMNPFIEDSAYNVKEWILKAMKYEP